MSSCLVVFLCRVVVFHPTRCELTYSGLAWYPVYGLRLWIAWQGTLCTDWDAVWIGKVPGLRNRLWLVPSVRHGLVDGLERYLMYRMGLWMDWKGARSTVWVMVSTWRVDWECGWLGKVPHLHNGIADGFERCPEYGLVDDC
jgi:hypothetical protein